MKIIIYGAGLTGLTCGRLLTDKGYEVKIYEVADQIGGMMSTYYENGVEIHANGAHIFHTDSEDVYNFVRRFTDVIPYKHRVKALVHKLNEELYVSLPLSLKSLSDISGIPDDDVEGLRWLLSATSGAKHQNKTIQSLISKIGWDLYDYVIKPYSEKQWGCNFEKIPEGVIDRIGMTDDFNEYYFKDKYQFLPSPGYKQFLSNLADGLNIELSHPRKNFNPSEGDVIIYTGPIDDFFGNRGLQYRSLNWKDAWMDVNTEYDLPVLNLPQDPNYTRMIIHNNFVNNKLPLKKVLVSFETSIKWTSGYIRYYPVNDEINQSLYNELLERVHKEYPNVIMAGRIGSYKYLDMDDAILEAMKLCESL